MSHDDFEFEPVRGLPAHLPAGEKMLWQGAPRWQDLAVHAFHARKVLIYFLLLAAGQGVVRLVSGSTAADATRPFLWLIPLGLAAAAILTALAYASARTSVYTITDRRLVMRVGIALPVTINLPFRLIDAASVKIFKSGAGDIPLKLHEGDHLAYTLLWPHARPWHFSNPQPAMRSVPDADRIASLLATALSGAPSAAVAAKPAAASQPIAASAGKSDTLASPVAA